MEEGAESKDNGEKGRFFHDEERKSGKLFGICRFFERK
ncbi:uncharacterized protein G2W53_030326 [Senna tora]|uniref:Uncharacterized protein n=1 Tax=Senna tora TaxID=362788 RepID=A0A834T6U0_9FABA|nr:uncharacterized protein G2W53_030326 [Senna tora]